MRKLVEGARTLGLELTETQVAQFQTYHRELVDWGRKMNLTAITGDEDVQVKHFLDSLTVTAALPSLAGPARPTLQAHPGVIDVGTGAGFPGLPLKIALPAIDLTLLEATGKKALFLEHVTAVLGLREVQVVTGRAEEVAHLEGYRERYDIVVSRAVATMPTLLELTLPFCRVGGTFVAQKQGEAKQEIERADAAARVLGGALKNVIAIGLPDLEGRCLIAYEKVGPTPSRYPRRAGMPEKRPLR